MSPHSHICGGQDLQKHDGHHHAGREAEQQGKHEGGGAGRVTLHDAIRLHTPESGGGYSTHAAQHTRRREVGDKKQCNLAQGHKEDAGRLNVVYKQGSAPLNPRACSTPTHNEAANRQWEPSQGTPQERLPLGARRVVYGHGHGNALHVGCQGGSAQVCEQAPTGTRRGHRLAPVCVRHRGLHVQHHFACCAIVS